MTQSSPSPPGTILVVDDEEINVLMIQSILVKSGYTVEVAHNGPEAIAKTQEIDPVLILMDINMPVMSGIEVCQILRNQEQTADVPIIFVTGSTDSETLVNAFDAGGTDYVRKPVNATEIMARIKSALTQQQLKQTLLEKEKLKGVLEMAGAICHEMNQPLQALYVYLDKVDEDIKPGDHIYKDIEKVKHQIFRMSEITKKISNISKYEIRDYIPGLKIIDIDKASKIDKF